MITDADVFTTAEALEVGVAKALQRGWSVPNGFLHRLSPESTRRVICDGVSWRGLPLSTDNRQDSRPYRVHEGGTLLVMTSEAFDVAPPDPRFVRWGGEDAALAAALHTMVGKPWRGTADLVHLYHPAEPRMNRVKGNEANDRLRRRYLNASRSPEIMHDVIEEGRAWQSTSSPTTAGSGRS